MQYVYQSLKITADFVCFYVCRVFSFWVYQCYMCTLCTLKKKTNKKKTQQNMRLNIMLKHANYTRNVCHGFDLLN